jgi:hypothetical protein
MTARLSRAGRGPIASAALAICLILFALAMPAPTRAAEASYSLPQQGDTAETAPPTQADLAQRLLTPLKRERCIPSSDGETIVVCGNNEENARQKLSENHEPDTSRQSGDGTPRAPNVTGLRDCSRGCLGFGSVPPPMYYFDITKLPEPPAGSDADRIARGEIRAP